MPAVRPAPWTQSRPRLGKTHNEFDEGPMLLLEILEDACRGFGRVRRPLPGAMGVGEVTP